MNKEEIVKLAESMGFKLDYDRFDDKEYLGVANNSLRFIRFISPDKTLDEPDLRWIWYKDEDYESNVNRGHYVLSRLNRKKEIQEFLKY
jgi:hypothetical protein